MLDTYQARSTCVSRPCNYTPQLPSRPSYLEPCHQVPADAPQEHPTPLSQPASRQSPIGAPCSWLFPLSPLPPRTRDKVLPGGPIRPYLTTAHAIKALSPSSLSLFAAFFARPVSCLHDLRFAWSVASSQVRFSSPFVAPGVYVAPLWVWRNPVTETLRGIDLLSAHHTPTSPPGIKRTPVAPSATVGSLLFPPRNKKLANFDGTSPRSSGQIIQD